MIVDVIAALSTRPQKAHDVGYITCRYNVRVIYAAWRRAALNGSSDVPTTVYARPPVTYVEIRDL